jgi:hypothetical protein
LVTFISLRFFAGTEINGRSRVGILGTKIKGTWGVWLKTKKKRDLRKKKKGIRYLWKNAINKIICTNV